MTTVDYEQGRSVGRALTPALGFVCHPQLERRSGLIRGARTVVGEDIVDFVRAVAGDAADQIGRDAGVEVQRDASMPHGAHRELGCRDRQRVTVNQSDIVSGAEAAVLKDEFRTNLVEGSPEGLGVLPGPAVAIMEEGPG